MIICPICSQEVTLFPGKAQCNSGHEFALNEGIVDLVLPNSPDVSLIEEEKHWDAVAIHGGNIIRPHAYINRKIIEDCRRIYRDVITNYFANYRGMGIRIGEIGSNYGSAVNYLGGIEFQSVEYIGADLSFRALKLGVEGKSPPHWKRYYLRASANSKLLKENSLDIMFCAGALHHLDVQKVMGWIPSSVRHGGLLILHEPSLNNPIAKIGRKLIKGFHTPGEKPLVANEIRDLAEKQGLSLIFETGLHFFNGSLQYLLGKYKTPLQLVVGLYYISNCIDRFIVSPSLAYSFIQIYKRN